MSIKLKHSGGNSVSLNAPTSAPTSTEVAFKLPNADGSANQLLKTDGSGNLGFVAQGVAGLTMVDAWGVSTDATYSSGSYIDSHWIRRTGTHGGNVGSAMTESSGAFTFPSTGLYLLLMQFGFYANSGTQSFAGIQVHLSTDGGSNYSSVSDFYTSSQNSQNLRPIGQELFDVTNASNFKIKFQFQGANNIMLQNGQGRTSIIFIRYGDT